MPRAGWPAPPAHAHANRFDGLLRDGPHFRRPREPRLPRHPRWRAPLEGRQNPAPRAARRGGLRLPRGVGGRGRRGLPRVRRIGVAHDPGDRAARRGLCLRRVRAVAGGYALGRRGADRRLRLLPLPHVARGGSAGGRGDGRGPLLRQPPPHRGAPPGAPHARPGDGALRPALRRTPQPAPRHLQGQAALRLPALALRRGRAGRARRLSRRRTRGLAPASRRQWHLGGTADGGGRPSLPHARDAPRRPTRAPRQRLPGELRGGHGHAPQVGGRPDGAGDCRPRDPRGRTRRRDWRRRLLR